MVVTTRSGVSAEENKVSDVDDGVSIIVPDDDITVAGINDIEKLVVPLQEIIKRLENVLEENKVRFSKQLEKHSLVLRNLQTRIINLEDQASFTYHLLKLHKRKLDDYEQFSRKVNLTIDGIEVRLNDSPDVIMEIIKEKVGALELGIRDWEYDRCHRIGKKFSKKGKTYQCVILKMCSWRCRDIIYNNRKRLPFYVSANLTQARQRTFDFAKHELVNDPSTHRVIDFVFVDENCKLKVKTNSKSYFAFSTINEFLSLVSWLDNNISQSDEVVVGNYENRIYC